MILDLDRLRMEYAKIYQVEEGSARREPLGGSLSEPSGLIDASFLCLTPFLPFLWDAEGDCIDYAVGRLATLAT